MTTETPPKPTTTLKERLMRDVREFHTRTGMEYTSIGYRALKNQRFWERLVNDGTISLESADRLYDWMAAQGYNFTPEGECHVITKSE